MSILFAVFSCWALKLWAQYLLFCFFSLFKVLANRSPGAKPSVTSQLGKWASRKLALISEWQMQLYCSSSISFIFDEPLYLTSELSIKVFCVCKYTALHRAGRSSLLPGNYPIGCYCSYTALWDVRVRRLGKLNLQTHLHPRPKKRWLTNALSYSQSGETNLGSEAGINKPNATVWRADRRTTGWYACALCNVLWWWMWLKGIKGTSV